MTSKTTRNLNVWRVPADTILKLRILCAARGISMSRLITELTELEWERDNSVPTKEKAKKIRKLVIRWLNGFRKGR
jgi:hypothetical protein